MTTPAIQVRGLGKRFRIGAKQEPYKRLTEVVTDLALAPLRRLQRLGKPVPPDEEIWALKDVSFDIMPGEVVGVIGRNGAGKSTLLKILSRITEPTTGEAIIRGRVGSLLEVGTGFHPELTGRENIFLNGAILGMKRAEIRAKFDEIVAFAEIDKFLDTPVKRYSSGMYVRLAFAVAAHLEPEILLVDEVLAVGDAQFQKKCLGKMGDVADKGRTVVFVSHNMPFIRALCQRAVLLEGGRVCLEGSTSDIIRTYTRSDHAAMTGVVSLESHPRSRGDQIAILSAWIEEESGLQTSQLLMGRPLRIRFRFRTKRTIRRAGFGFGCEDAFSQRLFSINNYLVGDAEALDAQEGIATCTIPELPLLPGNYALSLSIVESQRTIVDYVERCLSFSVMADDVFGTSRIPDREQGLIFVHAKVDVEECGDRPLQSALNEPANDRNGK